MQVTHQYVNIDGHQLHRIIMDPPENVETRMVCLFTHGQGDYSERYIDVLHPFTQRGIRCISTDLLGHGESSGKRGHCGDLEFTDLIIQDHLKLVDSLPYGIAAHSMGGLLTLRHLALALENKLPMPEFCWVNAPLIDPIQKRPAWFITLIKWFSKLVPKVTIKTGATSALCRHQDSDSKPKKKDPKSLGHQRVSIGWGVALLEAANYIQSILSQTPSDIPFLLTQGDEDYICPHRIAEEFFETLTLSQKKFILFPGMRHETFAEPNNHELFEALDQWLDQTVLA